MNRTGILLSVCLLMASISVYSEPVETSPQKPKNIILFIGDGMGQAMVTTTRVYSKGAQGSLYIDSLPYTAMVRTHAADKVVTDSAAAATAMATGVKTNNGYLGVDAKNQKLQNISQIAKASGKSVGLVTTTTVVHATPAAFYAHLNSRARAPLAAQLIENQYNIDLFFGGGQKHFLNKTLLRDFDIVQNKNEMQRRTKRPTKKPILGLFSESYMTYEHDKTSQNKQEPNLIEMTLAAINILSKNDQGFFLMVEGGMIDKALHDNRLDRAVKELIMFDDAIQSAVKKTNLKDTLILVTADHETGGLSLNNENQAKTKINRPEGISIHAHGNQVLTFPNSIFASGPDKNMTAFFIPSAFHTAVDVPLYAIGQGAHNIKGTIQNTDIFKTMKNFMNESLSTNERSGI